MKARAPIKGARLLAGEVAKELGVGVQTLHFYEQQQLIPRPPRSESGYRLYPLEIIGRLRFIRKAQALGFSLDEIKEILGLVKQGTSPCGAVQKAMTQKLEEVDRRLEKLRGFRSELASLVAQAATLSVQKADVRVCSIVEEAPPLADSSVTRPRLSRKNKPRGN
ncbi:Zn(2+)-responsive transcriptional regulator [soil metagenome]